MHSLTRRLVVLVLLSELLLTGAVTAVNLGYERSQRYKAFDVMLRGRADSVFAAVEAVEDSGLPLLNEKALDVPPSDLYEVHLDSGQQLGTSANWTNLHPVTSIYAATGKFKIGDVHYRTLSIHGYRNVDPDDPSKPSQVGVTVFYASPTTPVREAIIHAAEFLVAANFAILLLSGFIAAVVIQRGMRPLQELAVAAASVSAASWTFRAPASARSLKELSGLALAIERTLQGLQRSFLQQQAFVDDAAHELKTAVTIIKSSLQLLNYKARTSKEYYLGVETALVDCGRMEELVQTMLTLARVEQQAHVGHAEPGELVDSASAIRDAITPLQSLAKLRSITICTELTPHLVSEVTGEDWNILCANLVMNAIQHSTTSSRVHVTTAFDQTNISLTVRDSGEGILSERIPYVFDRFYRGDPSRTRSTGGTGLGLAICKAVTESYQGTITIESAPEKGTTVLVLLPARRTHSQ